MTWRASTKNVPESLPKGGQTMETQTLDPRTRDRLRYAAGNGFSACGPSQVLLHRRLNVGESSVSRITNGRRPSAWSRVMEHVYTLAAAEDGRTAPEPYITELIIEAERARMSRETESLVREYWALTEREHAEEAEENQAHATRAMDLEAAARADAAEAATQVRRAAITRELASRLADGEETADPHHPKWRAP